MSAKRSKAAKPRRRAARASIDLGPALATAQAVGLLRGALRTALGEMFRLIPAYERASGVTMNEMRRVLTEARSAGMEAERILAKHGLAGNTAETIAAPHEVNFKAESRA